MRGVLGGCNGCEHAPLVPQVKRAAQRRRAALRKKFMAHLMAHRGVPYARRYHTDPISPHHNAPLYLDCCGLIRKVLRELEAEFGFRCGGGNQSYFFDTLPIALTEEQMLPGDLVFIEAPLLDPTKVQHKHLITHVEVWIGDGHKTLGARYQKGVVQVHDSYAFESKRYGPNKYHFRSINTWLAGICKSFCPEHSWEPKRPPVRHTKASLAKVEAARAASATALRS